MSSPLLSPFDLSALAIRLVRGAGSPPMIEQLVLQIRAAIETTRLPAGARLPSSRALALELSVSRTVVTEVYAILVAEGYLDTRQGSGTFVVERQTTPRPTTPTADAAVAAGPARRRRWLRRTIDPPDIDPPHATDGLVSFRICEPEPSSFPDQAWRTCARAAISEELPEGYAPAAGDEALRRAIATWVARERGLRCSAESIMVTSGTTQSLDLIARAALMPGDVVAFEDPGYRLARQICTDHGAVIHPVPVDEQGLVVGKLDGGDLPLLIYTTPSHQFPMGSVLSYSRRRELLDWAACHDALIIEDDYDSEFRFDGPALPPLAASDEQDSVVYLGTFSKALAPSLRVGFLIAPQPLRDALLHLKVRTDYHSSWLNQRALARYLSCGAFDRHLRRMRRLYRERRDRLVDVLEPLPRGVEWVGLAAGLHGTLRLPEGVDAMQVAANCRARGVFVRTLSDYACGPIDFDGLVLGYGASTCAQLEAMAEVVRDALVEAFT